MSGCHVYKIKKGLLSPFLSFSESYYLTVVSATIAFTVVSFTAFVVSETTTVVSVVVVEDSVEPDPHEANPIVARTAKAMIYLFIPTKVI